MGPEIGPKRSGVVTVPLGETMWENLNSGLSLLDPDRDSRVLIATSDIPLITAQMVDDFIRQVPDDADLVYPVVTKADTLAKFPETKRTYVRLAGGSVTGGNIVAANPKVLPEVEARAKLLISHRKSPWLLARDVGWMLLIRLLLGRLSLKEAEARVSAVFNIRGRVVVTACPEIGVDIDKMADFELVERVLSRSQATGDALTDGHQGG